MYKKTEKCRICGSKNLKSILNLGYQELTGVFPNPGESVEGGPLELVKCEGECGLVQLRYSFESEKMYGDNYGYRSGLNQSMVNHLEENVRKIENEVELKDGDLVIDIGSNDGTTLAQYRNRNLDLLGMDPTGSKFKRYYPVDVELYADFFNAENVKKVRGNKKAKVITSIAMFYDLEDPISFAKDICEILDDDGIWVMEQSYLPLMIETVSYDTVCHEHLEFYALKQIQYIAEKSGLKVLDVEQNDINGGSFRLTLGKNNSTISNRIKESVAELQQWESDNGYDDMAVYEEFAAQIKKNTEDIKEFILSAKQENKKILGYGASTKGNVMLQYCDITKDDIEVIADVNEDKYGHVTPGTHIPIVSEEEARAMQPDYFLVLPWHFKEFILNKEKEYMKKTGCKFIFAFPQLSIIGYEDITE